MITTPCLDSAFSGTSTDDCQEELEGRSRAGGRVCPKAMVAYFTPSVDGSFDTI